MYISSLIPKSHPLMRRNVQVEFLGLVHTFATMSPSNIPNILCQTRSKKRYGYSNGDNNVVEEAITDLVIRSLPLLGNKPKKFDFVHQTVSCWALD